MVDTEMENDKEENVTWGWYRAIYSLAGEDILRMDEVTTKNHIEVFNFMTYTILLNKQREQEMKKQLL